MVEFPITDIVSIPVATQTSDGLLSADDKEKLDSLIAGGVASFNSRVGAVAPAAGDYNAELIDETSTRKIMTDVERAKLIGIDDGAQVNVVIGVFGRVGNIVATAGDYTAAMITETSTKKIMTDVERDKLASVTASAAPNPTQVSGTEKTAGTQTGLRSFSPADVKDMATIFGGGGGGGGAVSSVFGRTGTIVAVSGDYTAAQITEVTDKRFMTDAERTKLSGIAAGATVAGACPTVFGRTGAITAQVGDYTPSQVGADPSGTAATLVGALTPTSIGAANAAHTHSESDVTNLSSDLAAKAPINSPTLTGTPASTTPATSDNTTRIATTAFVKAQGYVTSIPVSSVAGRTGAITLTSSDVGLSLVENVAQLHKALDYASKASPIAGDKVLLKDQADGLPKLVDWNQLPSGGGGGVATLPPEIEFSFITNNLTWTDQPAAATELGGSMRRKKVNLQTATKVRCQLNVGIAGAAGSYARPQYSTLTNPSLADTDWTDFHASALDMAMGTTGMKYPNSITIPSGAKVNNVWIRFKGVGGDAAADPVISQISMFFELESLKGAKGDTGDKGDPGSAITTRASMSAGGDPPDADAVNMTNTAAVTVNMPALALARTAISFRLAKTGGGAVTFQGGSGRTIDGGSFTANHGTATAPIVYTFVSNPDSPSQWLRWAR